jgi:hypothetical protein
VSVTLPFHLYEWGDVESPDTVVSNGSAVAASDNREVWSWER